MKTEKKPMPGAGRLCPRCAGEKPVGEVGQGIALSRRGRVAICSPCGTAEAMLDAKLLPMDEDQRRYEDRIKWVLKNAKKATSPEREVR